MKFGFRTPSPRKSVAARTSFRRFLRHSVGLKAPRGWGWLTNPRKAAYNRVYHRTTFGWRDLLRVGRRTGGGSGPTGCLGGFSLMILACAGLAALLARLLS